jgi:chaperonin cofactor prefoldin
MDDQAKRFKTSYPIVLDEIDKLARGKPIYKTGNPVLVRSEQSNENRVTIGC